MMTTRPDYARRRMARLALVVGSTAVAGTLSRVATGSQASPSASIAPTLLPDAVVRGAGTLTWFGLRIYDASLWTRDAGAGFASGFADAEFVLDLRYARSLEGAAIATRSGEEIARLGFGDEGARERWVARMRTIFPDVRRDDAIAAWHRPGSATQFYLNGRPIGAIEGADFAQAFFSIWFDKRSSQPALREALIGRAAAPGTSG